MKSNLEKIVEKVDEHSLAIEEIQTSDFNEKLLGIPLLTRETGRSVENIDHAATC